MPPGWSTSLILALFLFLFTDRHVLLQVVGYNHHTMPEFTWDHFKADLTLSWSGFQVSRREKRIGPVWVRCLSWVLLAVVGRWGHRKRTRLAGLISAVRLGWRRGV